MLAIFIPLYNEELILEKNTKILLNFLTKNFSDFKIVFASNGSTDKTVNILEKLAKNNAKINYFALKKRGIGRAFKKFIQEFEFEKVVTVDIDLPHGLNFISKADKLLDRGYTFVSGYKARNKDTQRKPMRKFISFVDNLMCRIFMGLSYKDYGFGAKSFRREFLLRHTNDIDDQFFFVRKLFYFAKKENEKLIEIYVKCKDIRKSKHNLLYQCVYVEANIIKFFLQHLLARLRNTLKFSKH